jgi:acetyl-CoA synthetase
MDTHINPTLRTFKPFAEWKWEIPPYFNIGVACCDRHLGTPAENRTAMIVADDQRGESSITYRELSIATDKFAHLLKQHGIASGERVLIRLRNSLAYPISFLGAMKRGAIAVPSSTLLTASEMAYLIKDSGAAVVVTDQASWQAVLSDKQTDLSSVRLALLIDGASETSHPGITELQLESTLAAMSTAPRISDSATIADDPAYLVYTSGTTGFPKGVLHAHRALLGRMPASKYWFSFHDEHVDRIMHSGKFNWTYVLGSGLMDPLYHGKTVIVHEGKNDPLVWPTLIQKHRATIFIGVPTIYRQIVQKTQLTKRDLPTLRFCMSAGEHLSDEMATAWQERFEQDIYEAVGMSEFSYYLSQNVFRPVKPGSAGFPQPGHNIQLLNPETREPVARGEEGMICVRANDPGLFIRYWNLPEETAKYKHDGWFFTGDYARYDEEGYIHFLGRKDDIIKSFGYRVSPVEVERVLKGHPAVADCAVVGEDVEKDKRLVVAYVIPHESAQVSADGLLHWAREHLAAYKAPKVVYLAKAFPRTKNGKILRKDITAQIAVAKSQ